MPSTASPPPPTKPGFAYHCHGYEFVPSPEGTLFDTLAGASDPARVMFQIDVFHAKFGGADPAPLITRYAARVASLHLKDLKKGVPIKTGTAIAKPDADRSTCRRSCRPPSRPA